MEIVLGDIFNVFRYLHGGFLGSAFNYFNLYIIGPCLLYNTKTGAYIKHTSAVGNASDS